ncbi:hypothetical protein [Frankia sp. EAN1pec]|uniref:hypothetical protein n=1 Tax=Parafrankia sp. (strain EAN1pec) TaxID=298653 RepID=UPI00031F7E0D
MSALGNKITDAADVAFLRDQIGDDLRVCFHQSAPVRALEQGRPFHLDDLEPANQAALAELLAAVDTTIRDPQRFLTQMHEIHRRNARAWANDSIGTDLTTQIDPDYQPPYLPVPTPRSASAANTASEDAITA